MRADGCRSTTARTRDGSTSGPNSGEHVLAELLLEFRLERLDGVDEGLAVDRLDDLHAACPQLLELGRVELRLPGGVGARLGRSLQHLLISRIELLEHLAIGDEGDRREEMP